MVFACTGFVPKDERRKPRPDRELQPQRNPPYSVPGPVRKECPPNGLSNGEQRQRRHRRQRLKRQRRRKSRSGQRQQERVGRISVVRLYILYYPCLKYSFLPSDLKLTVFQVRQINGCLTRVPERFYVNVWLSLSRSSSGFLIGKTLVPKEPTLTQMTR